MFKLILLRHGKAVPHGLFPDFERPLTEKGKQDSLKAGKILNEAGICPEIALVSPALRTRMTWNEAQRELPLTHENLESALYEATSDQIVESVRKLDDKVRNICVVGHNPALQDLAARLTKSKKARRDIESHFPPGSLIVLAFGKGGSGRFNFGTGKVALFRRPDADHR